MDSKDAAKMEVVLSNGIATFAVKEEDITDSGYEAYRNGVERIATFAVKKEDIADSGYEAYRNGVERKSVDSSTIKVEDGVEDHGTFECLTNSKLESENTDINENKLTEQCNPEITPCANPPFRLSLVDEDGNILETYFEENGSLKQITDKNIKTDADVRLKKTRKKRRSSNSNSENPDLKKKSRKKLHKDKTFENEIYCCSVCSFQGEGRRSFRRHFDQHIKKKYNEFQCCFCDYASNLVGHINRHIMQTHCPFQKTIEERMFTCEFCEKKFFDRKDLNRHTFIHNQKGNLKCKLCDFSHIRKNRFNEHMRVCHNLEGYDEPSEICECDYCGYKCKGKRSIAIHIEQHLGIFRYRCNECGYASLFSNDVKKHRTIHSDERPFECGICSKRFKRRAHLILHTKTLLCGKKRKRKNETKKIM